MHKHPPSQKDCLHLIGVQLEIMRKTERTGLASEMSHNRYAGSSAGAWGRSQVMKRTKKTKSYPLKAIQMLTSKTSCLKCILKMEISLRSALSGHIPSAQAAPLQPPPASQSQGRATHLFADLTLAQLRWSKTGARAPHLVINKEIPFTRRGFWTSYLKS